MKKLLATAAFALILSACANSSKHEHKHPQPQQGANPAVEQALQECQQAVGASQDRAAFDACMKEKGFERPAQAAPAAPAPAQ
ncbi:hypothetical protein LVJ83_11465 [Uruburuella testudinis]|uniref:PsiF repeat-containing protein n=1 Tax=Uruburuella testudinis TaxID=1282863 RepID=A0ABY4DRL5_9NEIS|nr:hypothetical protein [Uruburuella testudinis]UOO81536.1 hypothetical protein LVJ83_11465 [Uruburuella testudinis]